MRVGARARSFGKRGCVEAGSLFSVALTLADCSNVVVVYPVCDGFARPWVGQITPAVLQVDRAPRR